MAALCLPSDIPDRFHWSSHVREGSNNGEQKVELENKGKSSFKSERKPIFLSSKEFSGLIQPLYVMSKNR